MHDSNANLIAAGDFKGNINMQSFSFSSPDKNDIFVSKINSRGVVVWALYLDVDHDSSSPLVMTLDANDDIYLAFLRKNGNLMVAHITNFGRVNWKKALIKDGKPLSNYRIVCEQNLFVCCSFTGEVTTERTLRGESFIMKVDKEGVIIWSKAFESKVTCIDLAEGSIVLAGIDDVSGETPQAFVTLMNMVGANETMYFLPKTDGIEAVHDMVIDEDENVYLVTSRLRDMRHIDPSSSLLRQAEVIRVRRGEGEVIKQISIPLGEVSLQGYLFKAEFFLMVCIDNHLSMVFRDFKRFTEINASFGLYHPALSFEEDQMVQSGTFAIEASMDVCGIERVIRLRGPNRDCYFLIEVDL
jgi:hypothetical protein